MTSAQKSLNPIEDLSSLMHLKPCTDSPSSVSVPVLSNTKVVILPERLTLGGEMQKILEFLSLKMANATPTPIAAGRAGGTQITIKLRNLSINVLEGVPILIKAGKTHMKPMIAMQSISSTNL